MSSAGVCVLDYLRMSDSLEEQHITPSLTFPYLG
jgi:hypothetical protein